MSETKPEPCVSYAMALTTAVQFLTRIPVRGAMNETAEFYYAALRKSVVFFPLVGGGVGLFTAAIAVAAGLGLSPMLAATLAIGLEAWLTGAFHEDAFADTWDALGGGWTRDQVLEIMKDSRLGTYGTIALVVGVGARIIAIADLIAGPTMWALASIIAASTIGRVAILCLMVTTPPITDRDSQAKDVSGMQTWRTLLAGAIIAIPGWIVWAVLSPVLALSAMAVAVLVLVWFRRKILHRVGGTTGDLLGCSAFLIQCVVLIISTWGGSDV